MTAERHLLGDVDADVIVVGLGPTGVTLAALLGQRGLRVAVLERLPSLFPLPRAIGLDHDVMRIAQELGVADRLAPVISPYRPSEYRGTRGQLIKRLDSAPPPHRLGWAPNYVFDQPAFEAVLRSRLTELPDVTVHAEAHVHAVGQDSTGAWADFLVPGCLSSQRVRGRYLVACDGGASPVRRQLGIALDDLGFDEPWLVVDVMVNDRTLHRLPQTQVQYCEPVRPCTYVVGVGNHRRWEIRLDGHEHQEGGEWPAERLWPLLARWIGPDDGAIWRSAAYRFHGLVATRWRRRRIMLAGDAAHMTPPFMAQGMAQGMRDAQNLAWKLERVVRDNAPDSLLDTYEQERKPHVTATTLSAMALGRLICEGDAERAAQRDAALVAEHGGTVRTVIRQDLIPGLHGGLVDDSPLAGAVLPQPTVRRGSFVGRLDDLTGSTLRVVTIRRLTAHDRESLLRGLDPLHGVLVQVGPPDPDDADLLVELDGKRVLSSWLRGAGTDFAVVRPDHHLYATATCVAETLEHLEALRRRLTPRVAEHHLT